MPLRILTEKLQLRNVVRPIRSYKAPTLREQIISDLLWVFPEARIPN